MKRAIEAFFSNTRAVVDTRRATRPLYGEIQSMRVDGDQTERRKAGILKRSARRQAKARKLAMH